MYSNKHTSGFSLLELLVVLVIIGFIVVLVPPRLTGVMKNTQTKTFVRNLVSDLRQYRNLAISRQREQVFKLDLENKKYTTINNKSKSFPEQLELSLFSARSEQLTANIGAIRFFPDGSSTGGRVKLGMNNIRYIVDINWLTGKVKLLDDIEE